MILTKYVTCAGIDILQNWRLLVQNPNNFNDPFELSAAVKSLTEEEVRCAIQGDYGRKFFERNKGKLPQKSLEEFVESAIENEKKLQELADQLPDAMHDQFFEFKRDYGKRSMGIICFSSLEVSDEADILMWAHYASSHRGFKIHIDTQYVQTKSKSLCEVVYERERPVVQPLAGVEEEKHVYERLLTTKSQSWKYENEWRWLISCHECGCEFGENGEIKRYVEIGPRGIVGVDLGVHMDIKMKEAVKAILSGMSELSHVKLTQAKLDRIKYGLRYCPVELK